MKILEMVRDNARNELETLIRKEEDESGRLNDALKEIKEALHLPRRPNWIECYDVQIWESTTPCVPQPLLVWIYRG